MSGKWVDNEVYFGPNRRRRGLGKRWGDRRTFDEAGQPPPLGAALRRLRLHLSDIKTADDQQLSHELACFAMAEAERQQLPACAVQLRDAIALLEAGDFAGADARVMDAQAALNSAP
jgi:hypothetical protein